MVFEIEVKRAIIMAAGKGERMKPLTKTIPKPLIPVNGIRMIDTIVDALIQNGITEIYVVVGYLKEQFYEWAKDKKVNIIENPYYDTCNNISSLYVARDYVSDCIILDGDQIIYNPDALKRSYEQSGYNAVWVEEDTSEWIMGVKDGIVESCSRTGGKNGWRLYSISRWTEEDGRTLRDQVAYEFERGNRQIYWDDVPMFLHAEMFKLGIMVMASTDVVEVDTIKELISEDGRYGYLNNMEV